VGQHLPGKEKLINRFTGFHRGGRTLAKGKKKNKASKRNNSRRKKHKGHEKKRRYATGRGEWEGQ